LLTSGETLEAWAAQRRIYALSPPRLIAATSGRFNFFQRRLIAATIGRYRWQDLKEARISAGITPLT